MASNAPTPQNGWFWPAQITCCVGIVLALILWVVLVRHNFAAIAAGPAPVAGFGFVAGVLLWRGAPYGVFVLLSRWCRPYRVPAAVVCVGAVLTMVAGEALLFYSLLVRPDPQSAVGLIFLPMLQMAAAVLVAIVVVPLRLMGRRSVRR